jgi:aldehyde:ferredoxin oxidoreductase
MLREKMAKQIYIWKTKGVVIDWIEWEKVDEWVKEVYRKEADQIHKEYVAWFKQEIEKLGVIRDEKIEQAKEKWYKRPMIDNTKWEAFLAQAQLQDIKDKVRMME